ncbi:MAG: phosphotransferase [Chloroflexota bacterium]
MPKPAQVPTESPWTRRSLADLLSEHGLSGAAETPFPNDGWSGAALTALERDGRRFILKRTSWSMDWIARSTRDHALREAVLAAAPVPYDPPLASAHLGAAADGTAAAILMPDLSAWLLHWDQGDGSSRAIDEEALDRVLRAMAAVHLLPWDQLTSTVGLDWPWCPIRERVQLLTRRSAERYRAGGLWVGERFLNGWAAFDRSAPAGAADLVASLAVDPQPLLDALARLPATGLHGDLKLANVALLPTGTAAIIDWQMAAMAPIALELGWFLVANVAQLPDPPDRTLERYRDALTAGGGDAVAGDWDAQRDLAMIIGLLLRGWRKGLDAEAGVTLPTGATAADDLAWWCAAAVEAAARRL